MKVVVGLDHSSCSDAALNWVRGWNWPSGTRITLVSACPVAIAVYSFAEAAAYSGLAELQNEHFDSYRKLTDQAALSMEDAGLDTESRVELGDAREVIVDIAKSIGADMVVVGSHGRTGIPKLLMGSVASHVVAHAPCSVMVVKQKDLP